jgi:hypothetical protein
MVSQRPIFSARTRATIRGVVNNIAENHSSVTLRQVMRDTDGEIIRDRDGDPTYQDPLTIGALVVYKQQDVETFQGEQKRAAGHVMLRFKDDGTGYVIDAEDQLTLPDGTQPDILAAGYDPAADAMFPTKLYF